MIPASSLRILIITPSLPYPPIWGFGTRVYQLLRHLTQRHQVTVLTYGSAADAYRVTPLEELGVRVVTVPQGHPEAGSVRRAQLGALLSPVSYQTWQLRTNAIQRACDRLLAEQSFDIIQVESSPMLSLHLRSRAPLLLDEHNIEYELLERTFREERSPARKLYNWIEYRKLRREEHRSWRRADACLFTSPREREIFQALLPAKRAIVVPNGVDVDYFRPTETTQLPCTIVFTGLMRYRPNADAVISFVREILPRIRRVRPEAVFTIVGSGVPPEVARLAGPNVIVTGTVEDVRPYVARSAVFVVPLRMGSGTRLKVLEGLAMGKAMVSTKLGCEGIAVRDGEHLLIADEPADFARAVLRLFDARNEAAELRAHGRALIEREYSWRSIYGHLELFYEGLIREPERNADVAAVAASA